MWRSILLGTMHALIRRVVALLLVLGAAAVAMAQEASPIARLVPPRPDPAHVFVLDSAHILSPSTIAALQDSARALQAETQADVAWVTLPTLAGRPIEEAALYIGRTWRIGSPGQPGDPLRNRGLVVLFVPDKRTTAGSNFRIEVGNGLEGTITDSRSRSISAAMREGLRAKQYDAAYLAGWGVAASLVREDFASHGDSSKPSRRRPWRSGAVQRPATGPGPNPLVVGLIAVMLVLVLIMLLASRRRGTGPPTMIFVPANDSDDDDRRRRTTWSSDDGASTGGDSGGGSSSSDGGSFGDGGGFSGGGSSDTI